MGQLISPRMSKRGWLAALTLVLLSAVNPVAIIGQEIGILESPVRWGKGIPLFPANTAKYYHGRYIIDNRPLDLYLTEDTVAGRIPPDASSGGDGWLAYERCSASRLFRYEGGGREGGDGIQGNAADAVVLEVIPSRNGGDYRVFLKVTGPDEAASFCPFVDSFMDQFLFFLSLHEERGRSLSFSGENVPELPAVIELSQ